MKRNYTLKRRAEKQAETRQRIVESALELHSSVGPALTTFSMIADRAGVQRNTLYAHFPDEWRLLLACSGLAMERDPLPVAEDWLGIEAGRERLSVGLRPIYDWYERNEQLAGCILRDAEFHPLTRDITEMRMGPYLAGYRKVLGAGLGAKQKSVLVLALSFFTWRTLVRDAGLSQRAAVHAMVRAIDATGE